MKNLINLILVVKSLLSKIFYNNKIFTIILICFYAFIIIRIYIQLIGSEIGIYNIIFLTNSLIFINKVNDNKFNEFIVSSQDEILSSDLLSESINLFFNEVISPNKKYFCLIVFEYQLNDFRTLSKGKIITNLSLNNFIDYSLAMFNFRSEDYRTLKIENIIFKYFEIPEKIADKYTEKWELIEPDKDIKLEKFGQIKLPTNNNYCTWGNEISPNIIIFEKRIYQIINNNIEVYENGQKILTFTDQISNSTKYDFIRTIDNHKYYIKDNKIILIIVPLFYII